MFDAKETWSDVTSEERCVFSDDDDDEEEEEDDDDEEEEEEEEEDEEEEDEEDDDVDDDKDEVEAKGREYFFTKRVRNFPILVSERSCSETGTFFSSDKEAIRVWLLVRSPNAGV